MIGFLVEGDIKVCGNVVSVNFQRDISENIVLKVWNCGMIKPSGKRFSHVLVHGIRRRNYITELSDFRLLHAGRKKLKTPQPSSFFGNTL